ncbi:MAG: DJ-1/PfpI family protein [Thermoanaerobaculia bacterium]|nr:DJ-1/PfpI family protein [Thermoanaerobaculia bacterium]
MRFGQSESASPDCPSWRRGAWVLALALTVGGPISAVQDSTVAPSAEAPSARPANALVLPRVPPVKNLPTDRPLRAGILVVDGVYNTELTAPMDILHHVVFHTKPGVEVFLVSPDGKPVRSFEGLNITPDYSFADAPSIDILIVPSAEHSMDSDLGNDSLIAWVEQTGKKAHYVMSLCDGAFVLAKAGLLDRKRVTTFPGDQDAFATMFPKLDLERDVTFVHDESVLTSQGGARSFDVALYFVDHLFGEEVARGVAEGMVLPWPPASEPFRALIVERKWRW